MARKVFISFLGTTNYGECDYHRNGISYGKSRFAQVVTLNYLMQQEQWSSHDIAYILMTGDSELKNWQDFYYKDRETQQPLYGLETCLSQMELPFCIHPVKNLPEGNSEDEIWQIFQQVFNECIQEGDELYFDITHGYRYLPTLIIVLGNYAKFLRNVTVKSITYGNWEISQQGKKPGLLIDLLPLSTLQDWTFASGQYLRSGDATQLEQVGLNNTIRPLMKKAKGTDPNVTNLYKYVKLLSQFSEEMRTCRGIDIAKAKTIKPLNEISASVDSSIIPPLEPVLQKMQQSIANFSNEENVINGIHAATWCYNHALYQQAATILEESIVSIVCIDNGIDWHNEEQRKIINAAFFTQTNPDKELNPEFNDKTELIQSIKAGKTFLNLYPIYNTLSELRNDINHSGIRNNYMSPTSLITKLGTCITNAQKLYSPNAD